MHYRQRTDPFKLNSEKTIDTAQKCSQDFDAIYSASDVFKKRFEDLAQDHATELDATIMEIQHDIKYLDAEIYKYVESLLWVKHRFPSSFEGVQQFPWALSWPLLSVASPW
jgi:hypothetical protein